jgi:hypothetical protein
MVNYKVEEKSSLLIDRSKSNVSSSIIQTLEKKIIKRQKINKPASNVQCHHLSLRKTGEVDFWERTAGWDSFFATFCRDFIKD